MVINFPPLDVELLTLFNAAFNKLLHSGHQVAPGQFCTVLTLIRGCFRHRVIRLDMPSSLVQLVRERTGPRLASLPSSFARGSTAQSERSLCSTDCNDSPLSE
jgi:hypothetical protein